MSGRFITLEGGEGAGKSTQARLLADTLAAAGVPVLRTREPGGSRGAERLRTLLLDPAEEWSALGETLLHFAARAEHVEKTIRPALKAGMWVVCDRFHDSTRAYQGTGEAADPAKIGALIDMIGLVPDLTLVLDVPAAIAAERLRTRGGVADRYELKGAAFHARVNASFRQIARDEPNRCVLIDASGDEGVVQAAIIDAVARRGWKGFGG